jgi:hypothetical protein
MRGSPFRVTTTFDSENDQTQLTIPLALILMRGQFSAVNWTHLQSDVAPRGHRVRLQNRRKIPCSNPARL